jgi:hypothetical protein
MLSVNSINYFLSLRGKYKNEGLEKLTDTLLRERKLERERDRFE